MERLRNEKQLQYITKMMLQMGMPVHLRGFHYLREAVYMTIEDMELVSSVTKLLYPEVAKKFRTENEKIERAIRSLIEVGWQRGNEDLYEEIFGYSRLSGMKRPTNSEFIIAMSDWARMEFGLDL